MSDAQIDAALQRGKFARLQESRANAARYDKKLDRVIVELTNGCTFTFPPRLAQGLQTAAPEQLTLVEIPGTGTGLHWEALDINLLIQGCSAA